MYCLLYIRPIRRVKSNLVVCLNQGKLFLPFYTFDSKSSYSFQRDNTGSLSFALSLCLDTAGTFQMLSWLWFLYWAYQSTVGNNEKIEWSDMYASFILHRNSPNKASNVWLLSSLRKVPINIHSPGQITLHLLAPAPASNDGNLTKSTGIWIIIIIHQSTKHACSTLSSKHKTPDNKVTLSRWSTNPPSFKFDKNWIELGNQSVSRPDDPRLGFCENRNIIHWDVTRNSCLYALLGAARVRWQKQ